MNPPRRISTHVIDSMACAAVPSLLPAETWVIRDLTERDFGIDKIMERFEDGLATSEIVLLQIKGTKGIINPIDPKFSIATKTLLYAEMFSVPFLLLYCSVNAPVECYYLWLQEYIRVRLNYENPNWRNQKTNTVYFPQTNRLGTTKAQDHLAYIAQFPQYRSSWVSYYLSLRDLCYNLPMALDYDTMDKEQINMIIEPAIPKLEIAIQKAKYIPKRFIPDSFTDTINLGKKILSLPYKPDMECFFRFICNCQNIQKSVEMIALRFDEAHLRFLYEFDGTADF